MATTVHQTAEISGSLKRPGLRVAIGATAPCVPLLQCDSTANGTAPSNKRFFVRVLPTNAAEIIGGPPPGRGAGGGGKIPHISGISGPARLLGHTKRLITVDDVDIENILSRKPVLALSDQHRLDGFLQRVSRSGLGPRCGRYHWPVA